MRLFICLFDSPRHSARGAGGPTKVRCQRGERKIERRGMSYGERREIAAREWRRGRLRAGSVGGWVGGFGNTVRTSFLLLVVKQRCEFCNGSAHSPSGVGCKNLSSLRSAFVEGTPNKFKSSLLCTQQKRD